MRERLDPLLDGVALIGERDLGALIGHGLGDAPGDRAVIGDAEHDAALARHQFAAVSHRSCALRKGRRFIGSRQPGRKAFRRRRIEANRRGLRLARLPAGESRVAENAARSASSAPHAREGVLLARAERGESLASDSGLPACPCVFAVNGPSAAGLDLTDLRHREPSFNPRATRSRRTRGRQRLRSAADRCRARASRRHGGTRGLGRRGRPTPA